MRTHVHRAARAMLPSLLVVAAAVPGAAQEGGVERTRWEVAGVPALNYDSDEGFGYGAAAEIYRHAPGARPYVFTLQPVVQLSTRGRRDVTVFFDAPHLLPGGWRLDAFAGSEKHLATPYYGIGNETAFEEARTLEGSGTPYYYRFGRTRNQALLNLQRPLGGLPLRALVGAGVSRVEIDPVPYDSGTTLLASQLGSGALPGGWSNSVRAGLVWDTRDREIGPTRGSWSEVLVQRVDRALGSDHEYTRWTVTDRRYLRLGSERLVYANRLLLQGVEGDAPFYDLSQLQTSFRQQEGLGGAKSMRGVPKNRYVGEGMFLWNAEVRWRAADFRVAGRPLHLVLSGFADSGRVWSGGVRPQEIATDLHHGVGGGVRLGMGESFVVAVDVGHSSETLAPFYIGLGYLY